MQPIEFDQSNWPILVIKHPEEPVDKEFTIPYLETLEGYFNRGEKFCAVFIVTGSKPPTAEHRFMVANWVKQKESLIKSVILGTAYVMPSLIQKLALITFLKFLDTTEIISPVKVFRSYTKAMTWANERCQSLKLPLLAEEKN